MTLNWNFFSAWEISRIRYDIYIKKIVPPEIEIKMLLFALLRDLRIEAVKINLDI